MPKNKTIQQNTKVINDFFWFHKEETAKEMSKFLFNLQGVFFAQPNVNLSDEYKDLCVMHFEALFNLVNELQPVKQ